MSIGKIQIACADCGKIRFRHPCEVLKASKLCRSCSMMGMKNQFWKGGRKVNRKGYVLLIPASGGKRALEHRLVMEQHIGRKLRPTESVHHVNGVRDDNRIENLELWMSSHPAGQRIEDCAFDDGSGDYFSLAA